MKEIQLSKGYVALVDDEDYERCMEGTKWYANVEHCADGSIWNVYAMRTIPKGNGKRTSQQMHNFITGRKGDDHRDGNGLNNQRYNLRAATILQNTSSRRLNKNNISGYKGVSWDKRGSMWLATIRVSTKRFHLGYFSDILDAARAYDRAALKYFGEFALTNVMLGLLPKEL